MTDMFAMFEDGPDVDDRSTRSIHDEVPATESPASAAAPAPAPRLDDWEASIPLLMSTYPSVKIGTLFCVYKVRLDPDVEFRDIQGEARLRDIPLSGRSLHQAKVLLGIEAPRPMAPRRRRADAEPDGEEERDEFSFRPESIPAPRAAVPVVTAEAALSSDFESMLRAAIDDAVMQRIASYRDAIRAAIALIDATLAETGDD